MLAKDGVGVTEGLVGHWQLNDFSGSVAIDSTDFENHGILHGTGGASASSGDIPFSGGEYGLGSLAYTLRGTKTIGIDDLGATVYLLDESFVTDDDGLNSHKGLVWDTYELLIDLIDGAPPGYDIQTSSLVLPLVINPADDLDLILTLVAHTEVSLLVTVTDINNIPILGASVHLTGNGVDQIEETNITGQVHFSDLQ